MGIGPGQIGKVLGVAKAYTTRVGAGPFPTEIKDELGEKIQKTGGEYGATTGRPRRCGWLDAVALRYAVGLHGCTSLCLTKMDVLDGISPLRIATAYKYRGQVLSEFPADTSILDQLEPIYEQMEGWHEDLSRARTLGELPVQAQSYIKRVEELVTVPVDVVSVGAERAQTVMLSQLF